MNKVIIDPEDWKKLTEYVEDLPVHFYKAEKAVDVQRIFRSALVAEVQLEKPKEDPKE